MKNRTLLNGDSREKLKEIPDNSIDLIATDPPYGYSFMNKDWDKAVVSVDVWKECLRVLKPGAFAFVMSAPRQDVLSHMIVNLTDAGFKTDFTSLYWAYASGFPKAMNISKAVDKKLGIKREIVGKRNDGVGKVSESGIYELNNPDSKMSKEVEITKPTSSQAKRLDGSYAGFQPKPAIEVIIVCMKPLTKKNYIDQSLDNDKGVTWFDDCRIPTNPKIDDMLRIVNRKKRETQTWEKGSGFKNEQNSLTGVRSDGRFPANLLVSDNVLNDDFSKYFSLDSWEAQFIITTKPSKSEKNKGLEEFLTKQVNDGREIPPDNAFQRGQTERHNIHPTVKPVSLFKYLITLGSRENDLILDPFMGSGTTAVSCEQTFRRWIGIELNAEYCDIIRARIKEYENKISMTEFF